MSYGTVNVLRAGHCRLVQPFPKGLVPNGALPVVNGLATQVRVDDRWDDNSLKLAALTFDAPATGAPTLVAGTPASGSLPSVAPPSFAVTCVVNGTTTYTTPPLDVNPGVWELGEDGPLYSDGRILLPLKDAQGAAHPWLSCLLELRQYPDGRWAFDVELRNTWDDAGDQVWYDLTVTVGGVPVLQQTSVQHPYLRSWRRVFYRTDAGLSWVPGRAVPDWTKAAQAGFLPAYSPDVGYRVTPPTGALPLFSWAPLFPYMPAHSGRPEIAPVPDWQIPAIVSGDVAQVEAALTWAQQSCLWPIAPRERSTGQLVTVGDRPNYWLPGEPGYDRPAGNLGGVLYCDEALTVGWTTPDVDHQPNLCLVPYLISAETYYRDQVVAWGNYCQLATYPPNRGGWGLINTNQIRGVGWGLRNLTLAWAVLPAAHPDKAFYSQQVDNNLSWLEQNTAQQIADPARPLPWPLVPNIVRLESFDPTNNWYDSLWSDMWSHAYVATAIHWANRLGKPGADNCKRAILDLRHALFADPSFLRRYVGAYMWPVARQDPPGSFQNFTFLTLAQMAADPRVAVDAQLAGYYGCDAYHELTVMEEAGGYADVVAHRQWLLAQPDMMTFLGYGVGFGPGWFTVPVLGVS